LIITTSAVLQLILSASAILLVVIAAWKALRIWRKWDKVNQEDKYALEKDSYLASTAVFIALGIRLFMVPNFFWTMQGFVSSIPGAMCLWGVFDALPNLAWSDLFIKIVLPIIYIGWILVAILNSKSGMNSAMRGLMAFLLLASPLAILDSMIDIQILLNIKPVEVNCCSNAIDVGFRPIPAAIGSVSGQTILLITFLVSSLIFVMMLLLARKSRFWLIISLVASIVLALGFTLTLTEVLTPWLLNLPFHHCPFCLLFLHPPAILFTVLYWIGLSTPWLILIMAAFRRYPALESLEEEFRGRLGGLSSVTMTAAVFMIAVEIFAIL